MGEAAASLARACKGFGDLVDAIRAVRAVSEQEAVRAVAEQEAARPRGSFGRAWWAKWRQSKNLGVLDLEAPLLAGTHSHKGATVADLPAAGQNSDKRSERISGCSAMQGTALLASLTVLPYMGPDGVLKAYVYHQYVGAAFALIWSLVGLSVPCLFVRSRVLYFYTRLVSRIGMFAATLLVIFFCHWMLFPEWVPVLWILVILSAILHLGVFIWACKDGEM